MLQLSFDTPEIVSMEQDLDKIEVTFHKSRLFKAQDGSFVDKFTTISKVIGPQIEAGPFSDSDFQRIMFETLLSTARS